MADPVEVQTQALDRTQLSKVAGGDFRTIKFFENLTSDVSVTLPDAAQASMAAAEAAQADADTAQATADTAQSTADDAQADASSALTQISALNAIQFVTVAASGSLSDERVLTQGANITIIDGGAGGPITIDLVQNPSIEDSLGNVVIEVSDDGAASQLGLFGVAPVLRPTTAISGAAFSANVGVPVLDGSTFDGYTIAQIVQGLRSLGILT